MSEDPLVIATYALVTATILLVLSGLIPAITSIVQLSRDRKGRAARVVPDMNILHSRLAGGTNRLTRATSMDLKEVDSTISDLEDNISNINQIRKHSFDVGLKFSNEIYIVRHFNTCAWDEMRAIARAKEKQTGEKSRHELETPGHPGHETPGNLSEEARLSKAAAWLVAADMSLVAAEELLPGSARLVDGSGFWDRFRRVVDQRSADGEKALVDRRSRR